MDAQSIRLMAVGDLFMGEHPVTFGHGVDSVVKTRGADFPFMHVSSILNTGDIVLGNLEGIISDAGKTPKDFMSNCFRGRPQVAKALARSGFTALSLANNHTMQHGIEPLRETIDLLAENGVESTGINERSSEQSKPVVVQKNGIMVALFGYCCISQQYHLDTQVVCQGTYENIVADVNGLREQVDFIVVNLHWGDEFVDKPSPEQMRLGRKLIDAGVDIIVGHHSHVLQGIERYKKGVIVYSLGSFVKDLWKKNMRESVIFECVLSKTRITSINFTPICINDFYQPEILTGQNADTILARISRLSSALEDADLSLFHEIDVEYKKLVSRLLRKDRRDTYLYYLLNAFRYNPLMLFKNVSNVIKRRMTKTTI
jgi:poly-gamma-glutamate synthesis protein (capsule biosynthesis protein)